MAVLLNHETWILHLFSALMQFEEFPACPSEIYIYASDEKIKLDLQHEKHTVIVIDVHCL